MKLQWLIILLFLLHAADYTAAQTIFSGEVRPRAEFRDGYRALQTESSTPAFFISQRSTLLLNHSSKKLSTQFSLRDIRVWGDDGAQHEPRTDLHEAWASLILSKGWNLKLGRQELVYDDQRLLGNVNWAQHARSHDAIVLKYKSESWKIDLGGGFNQSKENLSGTYYTSHHYKALGWLWAQRQNKGKFCYSLIVIIDGSQEHDSTQKIVYRHTYGGNLHYTTAGAFVNSTFYYQSGQTQNKQKISAYMFSINPGYKWDEIRLDIGLDFLSGNNELSGDSTSYTAFNTLYATNHKFYGTMDQFLNVPADSKNGGLIDVYLKVNYKIGERFNLQADYHYFQLQNSIPTSSEVENDLNKALGSEIDFSCTIKFSESIKLQAGYSLLFAEKSLEEVKGGSKKNPGSWAWIMLTVKPVFYKSKSK